MPANNCGGGAHAGADAHPNRHADAYAHARSDPNTNAASYAHIYPYAAPNSDADSRANADAAANADTHTIAYSNAPATPTPTPAPTPVPTPSLTEMIQRLKQSVVRVDTNLGVGSGVIYAVEGSTAYIVTNEHVVTGASSVQVRVRDSVTYPATTLGWDAGRDLAVLSICCDTFQTVPFAESHEITTGIEVLVIGYPDGAVQGAATVTRGIISAIGPHHHYPYGDVIQTDAAINPGNSGGPVFSLDGKVVGIATFVVRDTEALGFAIPAGMVRSQLSDLRAGAMSTIPTPTPAPRATATPSSNAAGSSGELQHNTSDDFVESASAGVSFADFIVEATFVNPIPAANTSGLTAFSFATTG